MTVRKRLQLAVLLFPILLLCSIGFGLIARYFAITNSRIMIEVTSIAFKGEGGGSCGLYLYDKNGKSVGCGEPLCTDYVGSAPLYHVDPRLAYSKIEDYGNPIDPSLAQQGETYYPLVLNVFIASEQMRFGESMKITAEAKALESFPSLHPNQQWECPSSLRAVHLVETESVPIFFSLDTTTFDFTPIGSGLSSRELSIHQAATQSWIVSPKENTLGKQILSIGLAAEQFNLQADVILDVREVSGIDPNLAAMLSASGSFLLGLFGLIKLLPEIWKKYKDAFGKKDKSKTNKIQDTKFE